MNSSSVVVSGIVVVLIFVIVISNLEVIMVLLVIILYNFVISLGFIFKVELFFVGISNVVYVESINFFLLISSFFFE